MQSQQQTPGRSIPALEPEDSPLEHQPLSPTTTPTKGSDDSFLIDFGMYRFNEELSFCKKNAKKLKYLANLSLEASWVTASSFIFSYSIPSDLKPIPQMTWRMTFPMVSYKIRDIIHILCYEDQDKLLSQKNKFKLGRSTFELMLMAGFSYLISIVIETISQDSLDKKLNNEDIAILIETTVGYLFAKLLTACVPCCSQKSSKEKNKPNQLQNFIIEPLSIIATGVLFSDAIKKILDKDLDKNTTWLLYTVSQLIGANLPIHFNLANQRDNQRQPTSFKTLIVLLLMGASSYAAASVDIGKLFGVEDQESHFLMQSTLMGLAMEGSRFLSCYLMHLYQKKCPSISNKISNCFSTLFNKNLSPPATPQKDLSNHSDESDEEEGYRKLQNQVSEEDKTPPQSNRRQYCIIL